MKLIHFSLFLLIFQFATMAQNIEGVWQINNSIVGSTLDQCYQFDKNKEFKFHPSGFDGLNRIITIGGKYEILNDSICFLVEYTEECIGGSIERSFITTMNNSWAISDDCEIKKTFFEAEKEWIAPFKLNFEENNKSIQIGDNIYFLTQEDE